MSSESNGADLAPTNKTKVQDGDVAVLTFPGPGPDDEPVKSLVKFDHGKIARSFLTHVRLSPDDSDGDVYYTGRSNESPIITAQGFNKLNKFTGMEFISPRTIRIEDGREVPNPYVHKRPETDEILWVRIRRIGIVRNNIGNLVAIDLTLTYDLTLYFLQDLYAKWRGKKNDAPKAWGKIRPQVTAGGSHPACFENQLIVDAYNGTVLIVDLDEKEVINCHQRAVQQRLFADRNATSIVQRNISKMFYGFSTLPAHHTIPVVGWRQVERDLAELCQLVERADEGGVRIGDEEMNIQRPAAQIVELDDINSARQEDAEQQDDDDSPDSAGPQVEEPGKLRSPSCDTLRLCFTETLAKLVAPQKLYDELGAQGLDSERCGDWTDEEWTKASALADRQRLFELGKAQDRSAAKPASTEGGGAQGSQGTLV